METTVQRFGAVVRARRRQLDLTQEELARRIRTSVPYVGHLETGKRHPSEKLVTKLAEVLGLDARELFFLANPGTKRLISQNQESDGASAWSAFCQDSASTTTDWVSALSIDVTSTCQRMGREL